MNAVPKYQAHTKGRKVLVILIFISAIFFDYCISYCSIRSYLKSSGYYDVFTV